MTVIAGAGLIADGCRPHEAGWIEFDAGHIVSVGEGTRRGSTRVDDAVLVPGFIDIQINGVGAVDFAHADRAGWQRALQDQARHGVTACCPTLVSAPLPAYAEPLAVARAVASDAEPPSRHGEGESVGAAVLGVHLEGPFLGSAGRARRRASPPRRQCVAGRSARAGPRAGAHRDPRAGGRP